MINTFGQGYKTLEMANRFNLPKEFLYMIGIGGLGVAAAISVWWNKKSLSATSAKFKELLSHLASNKYKIEEMDEKNHAAILSLGEEIHALISADEDKNRVKLETTLIFDSDLMNLKTLSSIAHAAISHGFACSGITTIGNGISKIYIGKDFDWQTVNSMILTDVVEFKKLIIMLADYLKFRLKQKDLTNVDLSMFEKISLENFNPRALGEKKDFIYNTWQNFADDITRGEVEYEDVSEQIKEIQACAEFENANKLVLSEVGDVIFDELTWNRNFIRAAVEENKYNVN